MATEILFQQAQIVPRRKRSSLYLRLVTASGALWNSQRSHSYPAIWRRPMELQASHTFALLNFYIHYIPRLRVTERWLLYMCESTALTLNTLHSPTPYL
jgi:hypothetical protein